MGKGRKGLLLVALLYGLYSIGSGLLGIASENSPAIKVVIVICFALILAGSGFVAYKLIKRKEG